MVESDIKGVFIRHLKRHEDERGWLAEIYREDELAGSFSPVMSYISVTRPGVTRGPHEHREQTDFFAFPGFSTFKITLWDNRQNSATYGKKIEIESTENSPLCVFIPPGVVHAYTNTGNVDGIIINHPDRLYRGEGKNEPVDEIRHEEDPESPFKL